MSVYTICRMGVGSLRNVKTVREWQGPTGMVTGDSGTRQRVSCSVMSVSVLLGKTIKSNLSLLPTTLVILFILLGVGKEARAGVCRISRYSSHSGSRCREVRSSRPAWVMEGDLIS